jgi:hypothetical protein
MWCGINCVRAFELTVSLLYPRLYSWLQRMDPKGLLSYIEDVTYLLLVE